MSKLFALVKNSLVVSVVVAKEDALEHLQGTCDLVVDVTKGHRPEPGESYYSDTKTFVSNSRTHHHIHADKTAPHLNQGTEDGFEPFKLSQHTVSYAEGVITIGCKSYSALGFMDALHKVLIEKNSTVGVFSTAKGPAHGKFGITWDDAQALYDALSKVRLQ